MDRRLTALGAAAGAMLISTALWGGGKFPLPEQPPPDRYGTLLLDSGSTRAGQKAVVFSHWRHRVKYSCRVCHFELGFALKAGETGITEEDNKNGEYCGTCHDGTTAFGHTPDACNRCHTGKIRSEKKAFREITGHLPKAPFGNGVDWVVAQEALNPKYALFTEEKPLTFDKELVLEAEWFGIPPAVFPHGVHERFLDCSTCHPDIFNIKKKTTEHFEMRYILQGRFCGACHLTVAFPLDDCKRCHPAMR